MFGVFGKVLPDNVLLESCNLTSATIIVKSVILNSVEASANNVVRFGKVVPPVISTDVHDVSGFPTTPKNGIYEPKLSSLSVTGNAGMVVSSFPSAYSISSELGNAGNDAMS